MDAIYYSGTVVAEDYSGTTRWIPLTSPNIDFEKHNDNRLYFDPELSMQESACLETTAWNPYSRVEIELCDQVLREGEDRFNRSLKSRRKKKTGKSRGKKKTGKKQRKAEVERAGSALSEANSTEAQEICQIHHAQSVRVVNSEYCAVLCRELL